MMAFRLLPQIISPRVRASSHPWSLLLLLGAVSLFSRRQLSAFLKRPHLFRVCANLKRPLPTSVLEQAFCPGDSDRARLRPKKDGGCSTSVCLRIQGKTRHLNLVSPFRLFPGVHALSYGHCEDEHETESTLFRGHESPMQTSRSVQPLVN